MPLVAATAQRGHHGLAAAGATAQQAMGVPERRRRRYCRWRPARCRPVAAGGSASALPATLSTSAAVVRPATPLDLHELSALEEASRPGGNWSGEEVAAELARERAVVLVACCPPSDSSAAAASPAGSRITSSSGSSSPVAGWVVAWRVPPDELQILELAVHAQYRRRGLARLLLQSLLGEHRQGAELVVLEVRASNLAALELYTGLGFQAVGRRRRYYPDGEDALLLNLQLGVAAVESVTPP